MITYPTYETIDHPKYSYRLTEEYELSTGWLLSRSYTSDFLRLSPRGQLVIAKGYAWNGASYFPDFDWIMRAALVHDALYQLMRDNGLGFMKRLADSLMYRIMLEDGAYRWQAYAVWWAVSTFGRP